VHPCVAAAQRIADETLFPAALETDRAERIPEAHLECLAAAGLYGLAGPESAGGLHVELGVFTDVVEALASGCLATAFVWVQHHGLVMALAGSENTALRDAWLGELCAGRLRAGVALGGVRSGPRQLVARATVGGWRLQGSVPWVTGWNMIDALQVLALSAEQELVSVLVGTTPASTLRATPRPLIAANASSTVELDFDAHLVPFEHTLSRSPYRLPPAHDGGGRPNGSLALGVARRCCSLLGPSPLDAELAARRRQLDDASAESLAAARADAVELALRSSAALMVSTGSRALTSDQHAQRLAREALFLSVFGSRPAIRSALLARLGSLPR
jgi:alkylation response protein AidB-like acyl-CoA dehydrogenase